MDLLNRPLSLFNSFFSTHGTRVTPQLNATKNYDGAGVNEGLDTYRLAVASVPDDRNLAIQMFELFADDQTSSNTWENAILFNGEGDQIGFIEDMVVRTDRSDAGFMIKLIDGASDPPRSGVFVSVDDIEARGAHFVWNMPTGSAEAHPADNPRFVSVANLQRTTV